MPIVLHQAGGAAWTKEKSFAVRDPEKVIMFAANGAGSQPCTWRETVCPQKLLSQCGGVPGRALAFGHRWGTSLQHVARRSVQT